jgi:purine-nucleoside phosphorylase
VGARAPAWYRAAVTQLHVRAAEGAIAEYVLLPGDPNRARRIAERFFDDAVLTTDYRQMFGYTGTYRGLRVSVQATGMGCPSTAIVVEELVALGARTLVRVGTSGIVAEGVEPGDLLIATGSIPNDGTTRHYMQGQPFACVADHGVTRALVDAATEQEATVHTGLVQTDDGFYATGPDDLPRLRRAGVLAIEMEASALFLLGSLRGVRTGCALVASNRIGDDAFVAPEILDRGVDAMTRMTLDACLALANGA